MIRRWLSAGAVGIAVVAMLLVFAPYVVAVRWAVAEGKPTIAATRPPVGDGVRWIDGWFAVQRIGEGSYAIGEPRYGQCNFAYLFVGRDRALLFDSGPGLRDIARVVRRLTDRPVTALPSHLHFDHVGGLAQFTDVALPDMPNLRARAPDNRLQLGRFEHLGFVEGFAAPVISVTRWLPSGSEIDLGGRVLQMLAVPGHTPNSVALVDRATGDLYTGDTLYPGRVYAYLPGTDLAAFRRSTEVLEHALGPRGIIHGGHGCADPVSAVSAPRQDRAALDALRTTLAAARRYSLRADMPRSIAGRSGVTLLAKHRWMAQ